MMGRVVLTRRAGNGIKLKTGDGEVEVYVAKLTKRQVRLAITAPKSVRILRSEMEDRNEKPVQDRG